MPQNSNFRVPVVIDFSQKMEVTVMAPNHGGDPIGSILGPVGSHWVKKWVKTVKNYHAPKCEFSIHRFFPTNGSYVYGASHGGDTIESILRSMGSHWVQKMCQNRKKLPCPKIRIFDYPAVIDFLQTMEVTVMAPNNGGDTIESILGPMGSHWVPKMCENHNKLPFPKIRIFDYPAVIDFSQKMEVTVVAPNHGGDTIESILGPMGSHWVQKIGQNCKK